MSELTHTAFFGDAEHSFLLTPAMIVELERVSGTGIGALCARLLARDFRHGDLIQVIRLALIGGGTDPKEADALVAAYAINRPLAETFPLSVAILNRLWFGEAKATA